MTDPNRPGGIRPDADDIQAYQRERRTRIVDRIGDVPEVSGGGSGGKAGGGWAMVAFFGAGPAALFAFVSAGLLVFGGVIALSLFSRVWDPER